MFQTFTLSKTVFDATFCKKIAVKESIPTGI